MTTVHVSDLGLEAIPASPILIYGCTKLRDGSLSKPGWYLYSNGGYFPILGALNGPPVVESSFVMVTEHKEALHGQDNS